MKAIEATTCTEAWLKAATHLLQDKKPDHREYTMILEIQEPFSLPQQDKEIYGLVDRFLIEHDKQPLNTVINTIFPASLLNQVGPDNLLDSYDKIRDRIKASKRVKWGTYMLRLTEKKIDSKKREYSLLSSVIQKLSNQLNLKSPQRSVYEVGLLEPSIDIPIHSNSKDHLITRGAPCLSHLSFKLTAERKLHLTAIYRSHNYMERALGNLYGLAWLQHFVATRIGIEPAELVCLSTMAVLETTPWKKTEVSELISKCNEYYLPHSELANASPA